jgi:hypothetical protein
VCIPGTSVASDEDLFGDIRMLHEACSKPRNPNNFPVEEDRLDLRLHVHPEEDVPSK